MLVVVIGIVCVFFNHEHEWGEWQTVEEATCASEGTLAQKCSCGDYVTKSTPKTEKHTFSNGKCTICNLSIITAIGDIIKQNPDQYTSGAYVKTFSCFSFSSRKESIKCALGFAYRETDNTLIIQLAVKDTATQNISIIINNGVISNKYEYQYTYINPYGPYTDTIKGVFTAASLSRTSKFTYTSYSATSEKAFTYFVNDYVEDAATCTKLLKEFLNDFLTYKKLGFTAEAFNLK